MLSNRIRRDRVLAGPLEQEIAVSARTRTRSSSVQGAPSRPEMVAKFDLDMAALRLRNNFPNLQEDPLICFATGVPIDLATNVPRAHLWPSSEARIADRIDALQMLATVPNERWARQEFKVTSQNLLPLQIVMHNHLDAELPRLLIAPTIETLKTIIGNCEQSLAEGEGMVAGGNPHHFNRFCMDLNRVVESSTQDADLHFHELEFHVRVTPKATKKQFTTMAHTLHSCRDSEGIIIKDHKPHYANVFPVQYVPPLPPMWSLLNITNVVILFLGTLRELRHAEELPPLSKEMAEKEALARHFLSLCCTDELSVWRTLDRPASLPPALPPPPRPHSPASEPIKRLFTTANISIRTRSTRVRAAQANNSSSDPPEVEDKVLRLGEGSDGQRAVASTGEVEAGITRLDVSGDPGGTLLAGGDDESASSSGASDVSDPSTDLTPPDINLELEEDAKKECAACIADESRCEVIMSELVPQAQEEARTILRGRAEAVGMGRALEELLFRKEGLNFYREIRAKLGGLADEVDQLESKSVNYELHTCLQRELV